MKREVKKAISWSLFFYTSERLLPADSGQVITAAFYTKYCGALAMRRCGEFWMQMGGYFGLRLNVYFYANTQSAIHWKFWNRKDELVWNAFKIFDQSIQP